MLEFRLDFGDAGEGHAATRLPSPSLHGRAGSSLQIGLGWEQVKNVLGGIGVIDTFELEERCVGVRVALAALVRQVLAFHVYCVQGGSGQSRLVSNQSGSWWCPTLPAPGSRGGDLHL